MLGDIGDVTDVSLTNPLGESGTFWGIGDELISGFPDTFTLGIAAGVVLLFFAISDK